MALITRNDPVVFHFRVGGRGKETAPKAGATVVFLPDKMRFGISLCCDKDRYNKRWGRKIATARAQNENSRITNRRFDSSPDYDGELVFEQVKIQARSLAIAAASAVENPVQWLLLGL